MFTLLLASTLILGAEDRSWDHASVSAYAVNTVTGEVVFDENSEKSLTPASCMKVVTTGAAYYLLGPESHFETDLEYDGVIENGVLHGNIYIRGGGDPCLGSNRIPSSLPWDQQIASWVSAVQNLGIHTIEGNVFADASKWEKAMAPASWMWEDLGNYYGAGASALTFHENAYSLVFKPAAHVGEAAAIVRTDPPIPTLLFQNEVATGAVGSGDQACIYGSEFSHVQHVRGTIPAGVQEFAIKGAIPDPGAFCARLLSDSVERKITLQHQPIPEQKKKTTIVVTLSPPIREIIHQTNQKSINLYAEHLTKKIGEVVYKQGSTQAGTKAITEFWHYQGVDLNGFKMADGSGNSRKNLATAKQFVAILSKLKQSEFFPLFNESLVSLKDNIRVKSGSMGYVRGYVGYAGDVAFAVIVNNCLDPNMNEKLKSFLISKLSDVGHFSASNPQ
ncbi:MAG: D-alanyl-D-alanine carboxypeptidase/D-alanyl-D-alanine-endopeptidase [Verrucomicrobia bacterium]|nr:D-alanyl-D-alanine carboxypeptidase/D-alanyl-D-alanine-endopeptidase [Verrucomicrobiota bacterium]